MSAAQCLLAHDREPLARRIKNSHHPELRIRLSRTL